MTTIICKLVSDVGFKNIEQVNDGFSAIDRLRRNKYGVVLSDWDMCPMYGTELIQKIRQDPKNSSALVIMITAKGNADVSWLSGADGYLTKPFNAKGKDKIDEISARSSVRPCSWRRRDAVWIARSAGQAIARRSFAKIYQNKRL